MWRSARRPARLLAVIAASFAAVTCDLVTAPGEGESTIAVAYLGDTTLVIGTAIPIRIEIRDTKTNQVIEGLRYDVASDDEAVVAPNAAGDSLLVKARGRTRVTFTLIGSTFGARPPQGDVEVHAVAASAELDRPTVLFQAFDDSTTLLLTVRAGDQAQTAVEAFPASAVRWSSSDSTKVRVTNGRIVARANGTATITALLPEDDSISVSAAVTVAQRLARYGLVPDPVVLNAIGDTLRIQVTPLDSGGSAIVTGVSLPTPTFASRSPDFTITAAGTVTAIANDTNYVDVTAALAGGGTVRDSVAVQVNQRAARVVIDQGDSVFVDAKGGTVPLSAVAFDSNNVDVRGSTVSWTSPDLLLVRLAQSPGSNNVTVSTIGLGVARVIASLGTKADTIKVGIENVPDRIDISPAVDTLTSVRETRQLTATVRSRLDTVLTGVTVDWRGLDPAIATVSGAGLVTATGIGTTRVIGTVQQTGHADTSVIVVENRPTFVDIQQAALALASIGDTAIPPTLIRNALGDSIGRGAVRWEAGDSTVTVSGNGLIVAQRAGSTFVAATSRFNTAITDTIQVAVTNAPDVLTLNRTADALNAPSLTLQYIATSRNARGAVIPGLTVAWRSTNATVADVDPSGLATALAEGSSLIIAEVGTGTGLRSDTATLTVRNDAVSMTLSQTSAIIGSIGDTLRLFADVRNTVGGAVANVQLDWSSTDTAVARVDTLGLITARRVGTATVTSRLRNTILSASSQIEVRNAPDTVAIFPLSVTLASVLDQDTPGVRLRNALGDSLPRGAAQWLSDDATIAQVSGDGVIIALARGTTKIRARNPVNVSRQDSMTVVVTNAPDSIDVDRVQDTLPSLNRTIQYGVTVFNRRRAVIPNEAVTWVSRNTAVATISASGLATSVGSGSTFIVASDLAGVVRDSARLIVSNLSNTITITPQALDFTSIGDTVRLVALARNELGNPIGAVTIQWSSSNTAVATVSAAGLVTAIGAGSATVTARADSITNSIAVTVNDVPTTLAITSGNLTLASVGNTVSPSVNFQNARGATLPRTAAEWTTSDANMATVSASGLVMATGAGAATITATNPFNRTQTSAITVTVTNAPVTVALNRTTDTLTANARTLQYLATVRNAANGIITNAAVTWSSSNTALVTIDATGLATALAPGVVTITATAAVGVTATATLRVTNNARTLSLSPDTVTIANLGTTFQMTAIARNDLGGLIPDSNLAWASLDATIATVSATGLVTASGSNTGVARIVVSANAGALADTSFVTVVNGATVVTITSGNLTLASVGDTVIPAATLQNAGGTTLSRGSVRWTSSATNVATVSDTGVVVATGAGVATITATSRPDPTKTSSITVTVTNAPASVVASPAAATLTAVGRTVGLTAVVRNARGNPITGHAVSWSASNAKATVSVDGVVTAADTGSVTITATVVGTAPAVTFNVAITITNKPVNVSVAPTAVTLTSINDSTVLTASSRNDLGAAIAATPTTWTSSNTAVVRFIPTSGTTATSLTSNDTVRIKGIGAGSATVQARVGTPPDTVTATVNVTVRDDPFTVQITPAGPITLANLRRTNVPAVVFQNRLGAALGRGTVTWSSSNTSVATVNDTGLVTGVGAGTARVTATSPADPTKTDFVDYTVQAPAFSVTLDRTVDSLTAKGRTMVITASVFDSLGNPLGAVTPTWTTSNAAKVSISTAGPSPTTTATAVDTTGTVRDTIIASVTSTLGTFRDTAVIGVGNDPASIAAPTALTLTAVNDSTKVTATVVNNLGAAIVNPTITWTSSNTGVIRFQPAGSGLPVTGPVTFARDTMRLYPVGTGTATVTLASGATSTTIALTVRNDPTTVQITPAGPVTLDNLLRTNVPAVVFQNSLAASLPRSAVTWTSSNTAAVTVNDTGLVTAVGAGTARVRATSPVDPSKIDSVDYTVLAPAFSVTLDRTLDSLNPVGRTLLITATVRDSLGNPITTVTPTWTTSNAAKVSISSAGPAASITATAADTTGTIRDTIVASVTSTLGTFRDTAIVAVGNDPASISVSPAAVTITSLNGTQVLTATVLNGLGLTIGSAAVTFSTSAAGTVADNAATFADGNNTATIRGVAAGSATITATTSNGLQATVPVTVRNDFNTLDIEGNPTDTLFLNFVTDADSVTRKATSTPAPGTGWNNALGALLPRDAATWTSSNAAVASVSTTGNVTGVSLGTAYVLAVSPTDATKRDSIFVRVRVVPKTVAIVGTSPDTLTAAGQQITYTATVTDSANAVVSGATATWASSAGGVASIDAGTGVATAVSAGSTTITATSGGVNSAGLTLAVVTNPRVWFVNKDSSNTLRVGTLERPFNRIQDGLNAAAANDTVFVYKAATAYAETLVVGSSLTLRAFRGDTAAAAANCSDTALCTNPAALPTLAHNVGSAGIKVSGGVTLRLRHFNIVNNVGGPAVDVDGANLIAANVFVNDTVTTATGRGILVKNSPDSSRILFSRIERVQGYGVRFENLTNSRVDRVTVSGVDTATGFASRAGVHVVGGTANRVQNSVFTGIAGMDGIRVSNARSMVLVNDSVTGGRDGVRADSANLTTTGLRLGANDRGFNLTSHDTLTSTDDTVVTSVKNCVRIVGTATAGVSNTMTRPVITGCTTAASTTADDSAAVLVTGGTRRLTVRGTNAGTPLPAKITSMNGPAIIADAAQLVAESLDVNVGLGAPTGRGIWIRNAAAADSSRFVRSRIQQVSGWGVRFQTVALGGRADSNTIASIAADAGSGFQAGVLVQSTTDTTKVVGNTFTGIAGMDAVRLSSASKAKLMVNSVSGGASGLRADNSTFRDTALTVTGGGTNGYRIGTGAIGTGSLLSVTGTTGPAISVEGTNDSLAVDTATVSDANTGGGPAVDVGAGATGAIVHLRRVNFINTSDRQAVRMQAGRALHMLGDTATGTGAAAVTTIAAGAVEVAAGVDTVDIQNSSITNYRTRAGLTLNADDSLHVRNNRLRRNGIGIAFGATLPSAPPGAPAATDKRLVRQNDVFDNDSLGARGLPDSTVNDSALSINFWGDSLGARRDQVFATSLDSNAAGDSVSLIQSFNAYRSRQQQPNFAGSSGATPLTFQLVRRLAAGDSVRQAGPGNTKDAARFAFAVRVVDANGKPVSGISVTLNVSDADSAAAGVTNCGTGGGEIADEMGNPDLSTFANCTRTVTTGSDGVARARERMADGGADGGAGARTTEVTVSSASVTGTVIVYARRES